MKRVSKFVVALILLAGVSTELQAAPYDTWKASRFTASEIADPSIGGETADPDHDGIPNLLEYAFGYEPKTYNAIGLPTTSVQGGYYTIQFSQDTSLTDLSYSVEQSTDLFTWNTGSSYVVLQGTTSQGGTRNLLTYRTVSTIASQPKQFLRVRVANLNGISNDWMLTNFGQIGIDPATLAPNGSGLTILQCYVQGVNPNQAAPQEPFTLAISATGPYQAPANVWVTAAITQPSTSAISRVDYYLDGTLSGSVTQPPYDYSYSGLLAGDYQVSATAYDLSGNTATAKADFSVTQSNRYNRGWGLDAMLMSSVIAVDFEKGVRLDGLDNTAMGQLYPTGYPWFLRTKAPLAEPWKHIATITSSGATYSTFNDIPNSGSGATGGAPPLVAFGSLGGGTALYTNQAYRFGISAGGQLPAATTNPDIKIEVFAKSAFNGTASNVQPIRTLTYSLPRPADTTGWDAFAANGYVKNYTINETLTGTQSGTINLDTQVQYLARLEAVYGSGASLYGWGQVMQYPILVTHKAGNADFCYRVSFMGYTYASDGVTTVPVAQEDGTGLPTYNVSYTLDFDDASTVSTTYLSQIQFQGTALPSAYQGKSVDELIHNAPQVTDTLTAPGSTGLDLSTLNNSPELKRHPLLDKLAADLGSDPMALANYVLNEIELCDAIGYNVNGQLSEASINPSGVSRDALAVYQEKQGSPAEQCALLIYLLRQKGIQCGYVFPQHNGLLMFDQQLSKLLRMQIRGAASPVTSWKNGSYNVPVLIPVNYPWVTAYIGGKWVHLFPWLKDTSVTEGLDLWTYMPDGYRTGSQFVQKYLLNDPGLRNDSYIRSRTDNDNLGTLFELFVQKNLEVKGLSLDQMGMKIYDRRNYYTRWEDFPRPWATPSISNSNLAQSLTESQNPQLASTLHDIFDTVSIQVISDRNHNKQADAGEPVLDVGTLRLADLHGRRLLLYHQVIQNTTPTQYKLVLSLEPYDALDTSTTSYTFAGGSTFDGVSSPAPASDWLRHRQSINTILYTTGDPNTNDNMLLYNVTMTRHKQAQSLDAGVNGWDVFLGINEVTTIADTRSLQKGDMAAFCTNYGRVSERMQQYQAEKYWRYQRTLSSSSTAAADPEQSTGQILHLMGQTYFYKISQFDQTLENLAKVRSVSQLAYGLAKFSPQRDSNDAPVLVTSTISGTTYQDLDMRYPKVDMFNQRTVWVGNATSHLEAGGSGQMAAYDASQLGVANGSAEEHQVINQFFSGSAAISTVRLLDIAQGWTEATQTAAHPGVGPIVLSAANYVSQGNVNYTAPLNSSTTSTATHPLSYWATKAGLWSEVTDAFASTNKLAAMTTIIITPGPVKASAQQGKPFYGMGAMLMAPGTTGAFISDNVAVTNGGSGGSVAYSTPSFALPQSFVYNVTLAPTYDGGFSVFNSSQFSLGSPSYTPSLSLGNYASFNSGISSSSLYTSPDIISSLTSWSGYTSVSTPISYSNTGSATAAALGSMYTLGNIGNVSSYAQMSPTSVTSQGYSLGGITQAIADPVNAITGEFYIDALDLKLAGPMPLEIRRTYGSLNQADNTFGYGWRMSYFPYLMLSTATDSVTTSSVIYAAEMDGSVIAYQHQTSPNTRWIPTTTYNPALANVTNGTVGSASNVFNNRIDLSTVNGDTIYTLTGADGSVRTFKMTTFSPAIAGAVERIRPYLQSWRDASGNSYAFAYGTDTASTNYGQVARIASSNGNFLGFNYDTNGRITEAYTGDGRRLTYQYDTHGDLTRVTLPDASNILYTYKHLSTTTNSVTTTYSTHLITQETKPDGRILQNVYEPDNNYASRRVKVQMASVETNSSLIANATFSYTVTATNSADNTITGYTNITDVNGKLTTYTYSGSQITGIRDQLGQVISQTWHTSTASGGFPRSLASITDKRGLNTSYKYDTTGNLTQLTQTGNLTGGASSSETATTTISYYTATVTLPVSGVQMVANALATVTDSLGNGVAYRYDDSAHPLLPTTISKVSPSGTVSSTVRQYTNVTGASSNAYGLLQRETAASGTNDKAITAFTWNSSGFLTSKTEYTNTSDPNVTTTYSYNLRGELASQTDAANRTTRYAYDARGNRAGEERYDEWGNLISWNYVYYNQNGEPEWIQGPRYSPNDYLAKRYDGAGRLTQEIKWLSGVSADGSSLISSGYAITRYVYDSFGNLKEIDDAKNNATTMTYDDLGQMLSRAVHTGSKTGPVLATESFTYEAGGQMATHTNPYGGVETRHYTSTGKLKDVTFADGTKKSYLYDLTGRVVRETLTNNSYWTTTYDDFNRTVTRRFYDRNDTQLGVESQQFDRRGNVVSKTDLGSNVFTFAYDGLNRIKRTTGPGASGNTAQQTSFNIYDAAGVKHMTTNAAGERTTTYRDALGRPTLVSVFNRDGSAATHTGYWYAPDHNSVTTTVGTGTNAITTTEYSDTMGRPVRIVHKDGTSRSIAYDALGNKIGQQDEQGAFWTYTYDALNRLGVTVLPYKDSTDAAVITNTYTISSGLTVTQAMPGGITSKTVYDNAERKTLEQLLGNNNAITRTYTYAYYTSGDYKGLLQTVADPRLFTTTTSYDAWLRPVSASSSGGSSPELNQNTAYDYDSRGMLKTVTQSYALATTGPGTVVSRHFDAYGQLDAETVSLTTSTNSTTLSQWAQSWNNAGRRSALNFGLTAQGNGAGSQYNYAYNALGLLTAVTNSGQTYSYAYADNGLLQTRTAPWLTTTITQRDDQGRARGRKVTQNGVTLLTEGMSYRSDSRLDTYTCSGPMVNAESRTYTYDARGRLLHEPYLLSNSTPLAYLPNGQQTAVYGFDQTTNSNPLGGLGVRTQQYVSSYAAYFVTSQNDFKQPTADLSVIGGSATIGFGYDSVGQVSTRTLTGILAQNFTWNAQGRLVKISQRNSGSNDFDSTTVYDGLGRRLQTVWQPMNNGVNNGASSSLTYFYDPLFEFLELGVNNGSRAWKVCGPDTNGVYGGQNGCGGIDAVISESTGGTNAQIHNFFGDSLGNATSVTPSGTSRWATLLGGYGAMPGTNLPYSLVPIPVWRGHYRDWSGFIHMGDRYYDLASGRFLSPDPMGHAGSLSLYDYCNGDPVNQHDPDGRFGKSLQTSFRSFVQNEYGYTITDRSEQRVTGSMLNAVTFGLANSIATSFGTTDIYGDYVDPISRKEARADLTLQAVMSVIPTSRISSGASELAIRSASSLARLETRMASAEVARLNYISTSGAIIEGEAGRTTTILGSYTRDMQAIVTEMGNIKSLNFGAKPGGFNVLNVPDKLYKTPAQFWREYNLPWLKAAVQRNDKILFATKPAIKEGSLIRFNSSTQKYELSGFGKEYYYLRKNGMASQLEN